MRECDKKMIYFTVLFDLHECRRDEFDAICGSADGMC